MSLIADALKKAQSTKLVRRYLAPDPAGVLPRAGANRLDARQALFGSILGQKNLSSSLWMAVSSGILLFVVLFVYFFYGLGPKTRTRPAVPSAALEKRRELLLTAPPVVPSVEPLVLEKEGLAKKGLSGQAPLEKSPVLEKERDEAVRAEPPKVPTKDVEQAKTQQPRKKSEGSKVAVTSDLSEEVRYHFNLALFYQEEKDFRLARREYEKVVEMWPLYAEAHNNLGVVYKELGMHDQAIAELKKALALNPRYARSYHNLGVIYQLKGDWKEATKNYELALSLDRKHLSSYNNLGLVYRSQKRPHEAREVLEKALALDPYFPQTHYNLALVLEETGEIERARFHYQKFVDTAGDDHKPLVEKVRAYLRERPGKNEPSSDFGS